MQEKNGVLYLRNYIIWGLSFKLIDYLLQKIKLHSSFLYAFACFSNPNTARKIMNSILFQQGLWECMRVFFSYSQWKIETEFLFWLVSIWRPVNVKKELQFQVIAKLRKRQKTVHLQEFQTFGWRKQCFYVLSARWYHTIFFAVSNIQRHK